MGATQPGPHTGRGTVPAANPRRRPPPPRPPCLASGAVAEGPTRWLPRGRRRRPARRPSVRGRRRARRGAPPRRRSCSVFVSAAGGRALWRLHAGAGVCKGAAGAALRKFEGPAARDVGDAAAGPLSPQEKRRGPCLDASSGNAAHRRRCAAFPDVKFSSIIALVSVLDKTEMENVTHGLFQPIGGLL